MPLGEWGDEGGWNGAQRVVDAGFRTVPQQQPLALRVVQQRQAVEQGLGSGVASNAPTVNELGLAQRGPERYEAGLFGRFVPPTTLRVLVQRSPEVVTHRRRPTRGASRGAS